MKEMELILSHGHGSFIDSNTLEVTASNGRHVITLGATYFVIATGSRPYRPEDIDFHHPNIFDSDTILILKQTLQSITIYGAGVIGCEYASSCK